MGIKYKIRDFGGGWDILNVESKISIPRDSGNSDYLRFVNDIYINGIEIVEGADYVGVTTYTEARREEYPSIEDQLDKIYHSGVNAWKAEIKVIKDKYPKTQVGITSIASIPEWVNTALFDKQKEKYVEAKARLARHELANGVKDENVNYIIEPLPVVIIDPTQSATSGLREIRNPLIVQDEAEREAAQEVINKTPQAVIDSINT